MHWHILVTDTQTESFSYVGLAEGASLEDAVIQEIMDDHEFKTKIRELLPLDEIDKVEIFGVPSSEMRSTIFKTEELQPEQYRR